MPRAGQALEHWIPNTSLVGMQSGTVTLGNDLAGFYKVKSILTI